MYSSFSLLKSLVTFSTLLTHKVFATHFNNLILKHWGSNRNFVGFLSLLLNLLGWHWLAKKSYRLQVHNSTTRLCAHQVKSPSISIYPLYKLLQLCPGSHRTVVLAQEFVLSFSLLVNLSAPRLQPWHLLQPQPAVTLSCICESVSVLLVSSVWSLDSTYQWNHTVSVFALTGLFRWT